MHNMLHVFDNRVTAWIQAWPAWMYQPMLMITNIGQPLTVIILAIGLMAWALWKQQDKLVMSGAVILGTIIVTTLLKLILRRGRPETEYAASMMYQTFSFPSGHAAAATVGFGFLAYAMLSLLPAPWHIVGCVIAVLFGLLVCVSRIYLGAHYPSDVVGGILLGLAGLAVIVYIIRPFA